MEDRPDDAELMMQADENEASEPSFEENEELLRRLRTWEKRSRQHYSKWRQEARNAYAFVSGDQWSSDDKAALLDQMRLPIVFNRTAPMVDAVLGAEVLNRQSVRFSPREIGDVQANELISGANTWARQQCDAEDEESDAFADVVVCGMGWTHTRMDYEQDAEGMIVIDRVDPFEMWGDPNATKRNLADARYVFRARLWTKDELPAEWKEKALAAATSGNGQDITSVTRPQGDAYDNDDDNDADLDREAGEHAERVLIKHFQWWDLEDAYKLSDPQTGQIAMMSADELRELSVTLLRSGIAPPPAVKQRRRRYYEAFVAGDNLLEPVSEIESGRFTYTCITGKRDRNAGTWYGIVRAMMDPQMWANKWLSQILHILNVSAKGGVLYEKDAVENPRKLLEEWAKPDGAIELKSGALSQGRIQEREAKNWPAGLEKLLEFAVGSMPQVTGINLELLGLVQKEQAGVLEAQRKQAGYAILAVFFDSLRRYRKMQGRVMLEFIQRYLSDGRLIRIAGNNGSEQYVPLVRQPGAATYDIVVDEAPMSANQKEAVWSMMMQMMPMLAKQSMAPDIWAEFLRYSPLPSSVSTKISQAMAQSGQPDPQVQQLQLAGAQQEVRGAAAKAALDESAAALNNARAGREHVEAAQMMPQQPEYPA